MIEKTLGRVVGGVERGECGSEFFGVGGVLVVLIDRGGEMGEILDEPVGAGGGEGFVDGGFWSGERKICGSLIINRASIHGFDEFHDGDTEGGVAVSDGGLDGGSATIGGE